MQLVWAWRKIVKVFLKSWKNCGVQNQIRTISCSEKEKEINTELFKFYKALFEPKVKVFNALIQDHLNCIEILKMNKEQSQKCERVITEEKLLKTLKEMPNNMSQWQNNKGILRSILKWPENENTSCFKC